MAEDLTNKQRAKNLARMRYKFMHLGLTDCRFLYQISKDGEPHDFIEALCEVLSCSIVDLAMLVPFDSPNLYDQALKLVGWQVDWHRHEIVDETGERP